MAVAVIFAVAVCIARPFLPDERWKGHVKVSSYFVVALVAGLELSLYLDGDAAPSQVSSGLGLAVLTSTILLFCILIGSFWVLVLARGADKEMQGKDPLDPGRATDAGLLAFAQKVVVEADAAVEETMPREESAQRRAMASLSVVNSASNPMLQAQESRRRMKVFVDGGAGGADSAQAVASARSEKDNDGSRAPKARRSLLLRAPFHPPPRGKHSFRQEQSPSCEASAKRFRFLQPGRVPRALDRSARVTFIPFSSGVLALKMKLHVGEGPSELLTLATAQRWR